MVVRSTRKWINIQARQALQNKMVGCAFKKAQSLHFVVISLWSENGSCLDTQHTSTSRELSEANHIELELTGDIISKYISLKTTKK